MAYARNAVLLFVVLCIVLLINEGNATGNHHGSHHEEHHQDHSRGKTEIDYRGIRADGTPCDLRRKEETNCRPATNGQPWTRPCSPIHHCPGNPGHPESEDL
ncbi:Rapid ALkalinization Factor (RALF) [Carex littledalei]|uniref:Rapid ALkalinization Factor (RALF) n=1 Tax=Carex littledalei TaxID=544730 RepID=A0A833RNP3_9POAL|nr:Rapid ALkalinization Factor (RALF) [Carex littledalei]